MDDSYRAAQVQFNNHPTPQQQYSHDTILSSPQYLQSVATEEQTIAAREYFHPSEANKYLDQYYYAPLYDTKYDMQTISITEYQPTSTPDLDYSPELSISTSQYLNDQFILHLEEPSSASDYSVTNQISNNCNDWKLKGESPCSEETHPTVSQVSQIDGTIMRMEHYKKLLLHYQTLEEEKRRELNTIQAIIKQLKEQITSYQSYLDDKYFINKHSKKLHLMSYEALFNSFIQQEKTRKLYYREQHPKVEIITDLSKHSSFAFFFNQCALCGKMPTNVVY
jgi:hypothetical protein